jgi:Flp pilus assembly protein TadG
MVEMILVLPMLFFILFAIVELSRAWFTLHVTTTAVREGARVGSLAAAANVDAEGSNRINNILDAAGINSASRNVNVALQNLTCSPACPGEQEVVATANVTFSTIFGNLLPQLQTLNMTQTARMRFEGS